MKSTAEELCDADSLFAGVETIRTSMFSHYLISNSGMLEINAMQAIFFKLKSIEEVLDRYSWGILYPIYQFYLQCRYYYRRIKHLKRTIRMWRMERALKARGT